MLPFRISTTVGGRADDACGLRGTKVHGGIPSETRTALIAISRGERHMEIIKA